MTDQPHGLARGLTNYGDADFSLYLRRSFVSLHGEDTRPGRHRARQFAIIAASASGV